MVALSIAKKLHPRHDIENDEISVETRFFEHFYLFELSQVFLKTRLSSKFRTVRTSLVLPLSFPIGNEKTGGALLELCVAG
jgi:hypothetical protein